MKNLSEALEPGDVLLLTDGRIGRVSGDLKKYHSGKLYFMIQFMDQNGETFQEDDGTLEVERNLGQSDDILANFYMTRSIHMRLNLTKLFE